MTKKVEIISELSERLVAVNKKISDKIAGDNELGEDLIELNATWKSITDELLN